uniref:Uncharacterized protein n=1 Tax=Picea glauca TaxID=3330 RepID=A0A117NI33_PICGL|nr:hypothetical protein ABT39_MTgene3862 [Picea glauca]
MRSTTTISSSGLRNKKEKKERKEARTQLFVSKPEISNMKCHTPRGINNLIQDLSYLGIFIRSLYYYGGALIPNAKLRLLDHYAYVGWVKDRRRCQDLNLLKPYAVVLPSCSLVTILISYPLSIRIAQEVGLEHGGEGSAEARE